MIKLSLTLATLCLSVAASAAFAQEAKKPDAMMDKPMTMQECKDHMANMKKDGVKKDDASMKKDTMCTDMMKKDGTDKPADAPKK